MKILKRGILIAAALTLFAVILVSCLSGGKMMSITVTPQNQTIATGTTQQYAATATLSDNQTVNWTTAVTWTSSPTGYVDTNANGLATSSTTTGSPHTVTITATDPLNNLTSSATLTVADPISITVSPANPYMAVGTTHQFMAVATLSTSTTPIITQDLTTFATWTTTPSTGGATVSDTAGSIGLVLANTTTGTTNLIATYTYPTGSKSNTPVTITVTATPLVSITVAPTDSITSIGGTEQYTATGNYSSVPLTQVFTNAVTWSSSNTTFATIDPNSGIATRLAAGTTTITATDPITGIAGSIALTVQ